MAEYFLQRRQELASFVYNMGEFTQVLKAVDFFRPRNTGLELCASTGDRRINNEIIALAAGANRGERRYHQLDTGVKSLSPEITDVNTFGNSACGIYCVNQRTLFHLPINYKLLKTYGDTSFDGVDDAVDRILVYAFEEHVSSVTHVEIFPGFRWGKEDGDHLKEVLERLTGATCTTHPPASYNVWINKAFLIATNTQDFRAPPTVIYRHGEDKLSNQPTPEA